MPIIRLATFTDKSSMAGKHLGWDSVEGTFVLEEMGRPIAATVVEELVSRGAVVPDDREAMGAILSKGTYAVDLIGEPVETPAHYEMPEPKSRVGRSAAAASARRSAYLRALTVISVVVAVLASGFGIGVGLRWLADNALTPPAPAVTEIAADDPMPVAPVPAYDAAEALATATGYYAAISGGRYSEALAFLAPGSWSGDATATVALMEAAGMECSVEASPSAGAFSVASAEGTAAVDLGVAMLGTTVESGGVSFTTPQSWLVWSPGGGYAVIDRLVPWAAERSPSDVYSKSTGTTRVEVSVGPIYRTPWLSYLRLEYSDNGSAGGVPIILPGESSETTGFPRIAVRWNTAETQWAVPHSMGGEVLIFTGEDPGISTVGALPPVELPLRATRDDTNVMPLIRLP